MNPRAGKHARGRLRHGASALPALALFQSCFNHNDMLRAMGALSRLVTKCCPFPTGKR
jgi:hypothetical protein